MWTLEDLFAKINPNGSNLKRVPPFSDFVSKDGGYVTFGDNNKGKIIGE